MEKRYIVKKSEKHFGFAAIYDNLRQVSIASAIGDDAEMICESLNYIHEHYKEIKHLLKF